MRGTLIAKLFKPFSSNFCLFCINLFYREKLIKHYNLRRKFFFFKKNDDLGKCIVLVDRFLDLFFYLSDFGVPGVDVCQKQ